MLVPAGAGTEQLPPPGSKGPVTPLVLGSLCEIRTSPQNTLTGAVA